MLTKKYLAFLAFLLTLLAVPASAQLTVEGKEQQIQYTGMSTPLVPNGTPANNFLTPNGLNTFILSVQPANSGQIYITNETSNPCTFNVAVGSTAQQQATSFNNAPQIWNVVSLLSGGSLVNSLSISVPALSTVNITTTTLLGNRAVIQVWTTGACASTNIDLAAIFAPLFVSGNEVQGLVATGQTATGSHPLIDGGLDFNGKARPVGVDAVGSNIFTPGYGFLIGGEDPGITQEFARFVVPKYLYDGPLGTFPFGQDQASPGLMKSFSVSQSPGGIGSLINPPPGLYVADTGFYNIPTGPIDVTAGTTIESIYFLPGTPALASCYLTQVSTVVSIGTMNGFFQTSTDNVNWTDRVAFNQVTNVADSQFAGFSTGVGITPTAMTNGTLAAGTKVDGPIGPYGRYVFQTSIGGEYHVKYAIACN